MWIVTFRLKLKPTRIVKIDGKHSNILFVSGGREEGGIDGDRRRSIINQAQYSDDHQLFLGNLPLNASDSDLRVTYDLESYSWYNRQPH